MKFKDVIIKGEIADKYDMFVNHYSLFPDYYTLFVYASIVGYTYNNYTPKGSTGGDPIITIKQQVFINNPECEDVFLGIAICHLEARESSNYLKRLIDEDNSLDDGNTKENENLKFEIIKNYAQAGIDIIFDEIIGNETDRALIFNNYIDFFENLGRKTFKKEQVIEDIGKYIANKQ